MSPGNAVALGAVGIVLLPSFLRNKLTVASHNEYHLIRLQALDRVAVVIYGVPLILVTADLARGTGRFNLVQGVVQSAMGLRGALSTTCSAGSQKASASMQAFSA